MNPSLLIIERPGSFRDALVSEIELSGNAPHVRDDAMDALASLNELAPDLVLVSEDPGPPGASSFCRLVRRSLTKASVYRLGDPLQRDRIDEQSPFVPRAIGPSAIARFLLQRAEGERADAQTPHRAWDAPLGSLELGPLLIAIQKRWLTGRLLLGSPAGERELCFARGMIVAARSSVYSERLGALGVRLGLVTQAQVDSALDAARVSERRIGEALLELGTLDGPRLFNLLCAQLVDQVAAACNGGACHARFVLDEGVPASSLVLRLHPLTALLHAARRTPKDDVARVLDQLGERALSAEGVPEFVVRWLEEAGVSESQRLLGSMSNVRHLRERLRERMPKGEGSEAESDAVALALLRAGALRLPGRSSLAPADLRSGMSTLSPPSIAASVVRCARSDFGGWPLSPLKAAGGNLEQRLDAYLHGARSPEQARAAALRGPASELSEPDAELLELSVRASGARLPWSFLRLPPKASAREVRLACHALHEQVDSWPEPHSAAAAYRMAELRAQLDRALFVLDPGESAEDELPLRDSSVLEVTPLPPAGPTAVSSRPPVVPSVRPLSVRPPLPRAKDGGDAGLLAQIEPLVKQARWPEIRDVLAQRGPTPADLPPAFGLLYAIALKEGLAESSARETRGADAELLGIQSVSKLLAVPPESATAVVVAKRALRRREVDWTKRKASPRISFLLVLFALICGAGVGFLATPWLTRLF